MEAIIVPCTREKVWDEQPNAGKVAAEKAYTKPVFLKWKKHAEQSGSPWFILSTEYGLIEPGYLIPEKYDKTISAACKDQVLKHLLQEQGKKFGLGNFERVLLLDWEKFKPLVEVAIGDGKARCEVKNLYY